MKHKIITFLICALCCLSASSRPARPGIYTIYQPDGSSFQAKCIGDEFLKIKTTLQGNAIIQEPDGWWCYAEFAPDGGRISSGVRIGQNGSPEVLDNSRNIPYAQINAHARKLRSAGREANRSPLMKRAGESTKSETKTVKHGLVILAEYQDTKFTNSRENFVNMLTEEGYSRNGASGSAKEYFSAQFGDNVEFLFEVSEIVTLPNKGQYYGANDRQGNDKRPADMIVDACKLADDHIDFSIYDDNGDGYVDNVFVFFAGEDEAENMDQEDLIWSHAWYVESGAGLSLVLDGKRIDSYACTSELSNKSLAGIGTFCHEYSHTFDLPDLYDTDYDTNGWAAGMWSCTSLMDGGNMNNDSNTPPYYNAIEREILGIAEPTVIKADGTYSLEPLHSSNKFYRINTDTEGVYYLIECRKETGWDEYIGGNGMLIYRIDKSSKYIRRWTIDNTVNANASYQCADLIEADGRADSFSSDYDYYNKTNNIRGVFFPNKATETVELTPDVRMTNIKKEGDNIKFSIVGFSSENTPPVASAINIEPFMDAAIINFESSWEFAGEAVITWGRADQGTTETIVKPYEPGKYAVTLTGLTPGNKTYTASICFKIGDIAGESRNASFMTMKSSSVDWPYIFIGKKRAREDGTFAAGTKIALMTCNTADAEAVQWTFNDKSITPGGDCYFTLEESGTLRAYVSWEDGSEDIIEKKINVTNEE